MEKYICTDKQLLLLDKGKSYRNYTIDLAIKINKRLDSSLLLKAINIEIERNEGLRLFTKKKMFKWFNVISEPYKIDKIQCFDKSSCNQKEVEDFIDSICAVPINHDSTGRPFDIYQIVTNDCDYILIRMLHCNMDAFSTMLTLTDIVKVYFSLANNTELDDELTSVRDYLINYEKNIDTIKKREKVDTDYTINEKVIKLGNPTYVGCEGGYTTRGKALKSNMISAHPCSYYVNNIDTEHSSKCYKYCEENQVSLSSLLMSIMELYYSKVNDGMDDITFIYSSNARAKLSEKKLPLTMATGIFFRRIINKELSFKDFVSECEKERYTAMKHYATNIASIYIYLFKKYKSINRRCEQLCFGFIPANFEGLPQEIDISPYWPKAKTSADNIIYNVVMPNKNGSIDVLYRYYNDHINEDNIKNLYKGIIDIIEKALDNPDININKIIEGE